MSSQPATVAIVRVAPFQREPGAGQALAVVILLAWAAVMVAWATGAPAVSPVSRVACAVPGAVISAQDAGAVRIRFAESALGRCAAPGAQAARI